MKTQLNKPLPIMAKLEIYRCKFCGKVLFEGSLKEGSIIRKICPKCKSENTYTK